MPQPSCFPQELFPQSCLVFLFLVSVSVWFLHSYKSARGQEPCCTPLLSLAPSPLPGIECVPGKHVQNAMRMNVESREGKEIATFLSFATRDIYIKSP